MGRDQPTLSIETLSKNYLEKSRKKSRKMKSAFTILIAVLAIVSVSSKVLLPGDFLAKNDDGPITDAPTDAPPTDTPTDAPTDTPPTNTPTDEPPTNTPTDAPPTDTPTMPPTTTGAASISVTTFLVLLSAISMKL